MSKAFAKIAFLAANTQQYQTDFAGYNVDISKSYVIPDSLKSQDLAFFQGIATDVGGTLTKLLDKNFDNDEPPICSEGGVLTPRRMVFKLSTRESFSVPVSQGTNIITAGQAVRTRINAVAGVEVSCVDYIGEKITNLNDILGVSYDGSSVAATAAGSQYYSGRVTYLSDAGGNVDVPVKVLNGDGSTFPPIFGTTWATCVGDFIDSRFTCPVSKTKGANPRQHRRLIVDYAVNNSASQRVPQSRELPVTAKITENIRADNLTCGSTVAAEAAVFCIGYVGEIYRRIDRAL